MNEEELAEHNKHAYRIPADPDLEFERYNDWRIKNGLPPMPAKFPAFKTTFNLSPEAKLGLEDLATKFGYIWGQHGNVSQFLEALGQGFFALANAFKGIDAPLITTNLEEDD